ncbi:PilZ domain-containing protein [Myxococcota bacterium]|nr:PilZ domain-containing protein [Myxococcota bacterium]
MSVDELQRLPRAPFSGWVEITVDGLRRLGTGRDLSAGGIGVELPGELPPIGGAVLSEFSLPGISLPLELEGRIMWCNPQSLRVGVRFEGIDPGLAELLENFVGGRF